MLIMNSEHIMLGCWRMMNREKRKVEQVCINRIESINSVRPACGLRFVGESTIFHSVTYLMKVVNLFSESSFSIFRTCNIIRNARLKLCSIISIIEISHLIISQCYLTWLYRYPLLPTVPLPHQNPISFAEVLWQVRGSLLEGLEWFYNNSMCSHACNQPSNADVSFGKQNFRPFSRKMMQSYSNR